MAKRARFYAFALNEFSFRRISFTMHSTQTAAEASAYKQSGQAARGRRRDYNGAESAEDDLYPQIIAGLECFEAWAKECHYVINWEERKLVHSPPPPLEPKTQSARKARSPSSRRP